MCLVLYKQSAYSIGTVNYDFNFLPNTAKFLSNESPCTAPLSNLEGKGLERAFWNCLLPSNIITALQHNLHPGMPLKLHVEGLSWFLYTLGPQLSVNSFHNGKKVMWHLVMELEFDVLPQEFDYGNNIIR